MSLERQLQLHPQALVLVGGDTPQRRPFKPCSRALQPARLSGKGSSEAQLA